MLHVLLAATPPARFDCVYLNLPHRTDRNTHMTQQLRSVDFPCARMEPTILNQTQAEDYWPHSWAHGERKRGMMSLHKTTTERILTSRDHDLLVFEDDVILKKLNKSYVEGLLRAFNDDIIRFDCWGMTRPDVSCASSRIRRHCQCGGTHAIIYRTSSRAHALQTFYRHHLGDIDCVLRDYPSAVCVNDRVVDIWHVRTDIPKT